MADLGTATTRTEPSTADAPAVTRRRGLPGGRAVVGAFLVTLAAVGVFAAYLDATAAPTTAWVTVARDLSPGEVVAPADLAPVLLELPPAQATTAFTDLDDVAGKVVISPLHAGELVGRGDVRRPADVAGSSSLTFSLPSSRALAGRLAPGDHVDVVATSDGTTRFVALDLPLVDVAVDGSETTVTVALAEPDTVLAVAHAVDTADVSLARTNPDVAPDGLAGIAVPGPPASPPTTVASEPAPAASPTTGEER